MRYRTPGALRQALEDRLRREQQEGGIPLDRLRRRVAVERLLARLAAQEPGLWVVKGGVALEVRLGTRARTTRDLDVAVRGAVSSSAALHERLVEALAADPDADWFEFEVRAPTPLAEVEAGRRALRFGVRCALDGRQFASFHVDVVESDEMAPTELFDLPGALSFAEVPVRRIEVISIAQHFGEKLHALTRTYGERENSRVRDLIDLVLMTEERMVGPVEAARAAEAVFAARLSHRMPDAIPALPQSWGGTYAAGASDLGLATRTMAEAMSRLSAFWIEARGRYEQER